MAICPEDLPKDAAALAEMVLAFDSENEDLRAEIATLKGLIFGARSERSAIICAEQLAFDLERTADVQPPANDDEPELDTPRSKRRKPRRNIGALPAHLPRVEQVIEPASTLCPCCAGQMHRIGEETSEALDRVPAWLRVLRMIRPKYACRACEGPIVQAPAPARLVEGGMATTALIAHIAAAKYAWQSTLYRQTQILAGHGVVVDRQTLARWMGGAAWMVKGLYDLQLKTMHRFDRLFCDETPMPVLDPDAAARRSASSGRMRRTIGPGRVRRRRRSPMCSLAVAARRRSWRNWRASKACCRSTATPPTSRWRAMRRRLARSGLRIASFTRAATS